MSLDHSWITARLATGAALGGPEDVDQLVSEGVTHVIDCRQEYDDAPLFATRTGLSYLWTPTDDDGQHKPSSWFAPGIAFALDALSKPKMKVLTHCAAGVNRGPSMAYAIIRSLGWTPLGTETLIRAARPQVGIAYKADADLAIADLGY